MAPSETIWRQLLRYAREQEERQMPNRPIYVCDACDTMNAAGQYSPSTWKSVEDAFQHALDTRHRVYIKPDRRAHEGDRRRASLDPHFDPLLTRRAHTDPVTACWCYAHHRADQGRLHNG